MAKVRGRFKRLVLHSQEYGSEDEHMASRVFFTLDGTEQELYADVKQTVGSTYETGPLEVSKPHGYSGPFNHQEFQREAENYYRDLLGSSGSLFEIQGTNIRMRNVELVEEVEFEFEV